MKRVILTLAAGGVVGIPLAIGTFHVSHTATASTQSHLAFAANAAYASSPSVQQIAINAVGGGSIVHVSKDTYHGQSVYDIHVSYQNTVYDVKVTRTTHAVLLKKVSTESSPAPTPSSPPSSSSSPRPSAVSRSQGQQIALKTYPNGNIIHVSADHVGGIAVWDIHLQSQGKIYDIKVNRQSGVVVSHRLASEQPSSSRSTLPSKPESSKSSSKSAPTSPSSRQESSITVWNKKTQSIPSALQNPVNQALAQQKGHLKWVKFIAKSHNDFLMNIKIRKIHGGTLKVKDLFNSSGRLLSSKRNG